MGNEPINITYVTMQWPCSSETFCARDLLALHELGHQLNVLALRPAPPNAGYILKSQMTGHIRSQVLTFSRYIAGAINALRYPQVLCHFIGSVLKNEREFAHKKAFILLIPSFFWAAEEIIRNRPDIVHLFWGHYPSAVAEILKLRLKEKSPPVTIFLGAYDLNMGLSLSEKIAKSADAVFTHAKANVETLEKMGIPTSHINSIHRGIDISAMDKVTADGTPSDRDPSRMVFVGRLIKEKGIEPLLRSMKKIIERYPDMHLDIIGDGPEMQCLQNLSKTIGIESHVNFRGYLPPDDVYRSLYQSGFFIFPSTSSGERLPNSVKEAMYAGVIPIVSNTTGIEELVSHGQNGFILEDVSSECISRSVVEILEQENLQDISKNAHRTIADNFDVKVSMKRYSAVWEEILKS